jgi:prepilin-type N-terminal cleavage/methylation domain-containing protein/prepilin-type processing-associated H-X9-DG protein
MRDRTRFTRRRRRAAFTLIELLVVVAIIALLVSILLPSLAKARAQAVRTACQANMHQMVVAFMSYSVETRGRLPGCGYKADAGSDWLGRYNTGGRMPQDGMVYKYLGNQGGVYSCPGFIPAANQFAVSYSVNTLMSGALLEMVRGAHYRYTAKGSATNYSDADHRQGLQAMPAPILVEEDYEYSLSKVSNGAWDNTDCVSQRHLGSGNMAWHDGSIGQVKLPPGDFSKAKGTVFAARSHCIRTARRCVSAVSVADSTKNNKDGTYGILDRAPDANAAGLVRH